MAQESIDSFDEPRLNRLEDLFDDFLRETVSPSLRCVLVTPAIKLIHEGVLLLPFLFCNISVTRDALLLKYQSEVTPSLKSFTPQSPDSLRPRETTPAVAVSAVAIYYNVSQSSLYKIPESNLAVLNVTGILALLVSFSSYVRLLRWAVMFHFATAGVVFVTWGYWRHWLLDPSRSPDAHLSLIGFLVTVFVYSRNYDVSTESCIRSRHRSKVRLTPFVNLAAACVLVFWFWRMFWDGDLQFKVAISALVVPTLIWLVSLRKPAFNGYETVALFFFAGDLGFLVWARNLVPVNSIDAMPYTGSLVLVVGWLATEIILRLHLSARCHETGFVSGHPSTKD